MRLIDADELMEHVWKDKLDSRELIAKMVDDAPTVKEITTKIPINVFEKLVSQELKTGHWTPRNAYLYRYRCSECGQESEKYDYCPHCGAKMIESEE